MDIEEIAAKRPGALVRMAVDIRRGLTRGAEAATLVRGLGSAQPKARLADAPRAALRGLRAIDAELVEINPLVVTRDGRLVALDCKFAMDDSGIARHRTVAPRGHAARS